jgi:type II secretory pathway component GspD/PulD (secretin)
MKMNKKVIKIFFVFSLLFFLAGLVYPQQEASLGQQQKDSLGEIDESLAKKMSRQISLDLRGMEIIDTLKFLAKQGNLNIVATKNVKGRVTLFLKDVAIKDMLDIILLTNDLAMAVDKNVITIMTSSEYESYYGEKYIDKRDIKTVQIRYADPTKVGTILNNIRSKVGKVIVDSATATVLLMDTPKKIEEMQEAIKAVDIPTVKRVVPTVTKIFELDYAKVADIKEKLASSLEDKIGNIRSDVRTNTLVVTALPHNMKKIEKLITAFDSQTKSVFLDAQILELTLSDDYYYGVDWSKIFKGSDGLQIDGTYPFTGSGTSSMQLTLGELAGDNYEITLNLLKHIGKTKIVSSPQIYVNNNQEAKFMVGTREAYVTTTTSTGEVTTTTSESVEFIDVGVSVYVTPVINKEGCVRLHIKPEVSSVRDWLTTSEGNEIPIVETSNLETDVLVDDGNTIILAGLIKETEEDDENKIPLLGDIPFLGNAFRNVKKVKERKELIILLTPHVVTGKKEDLEEERKEKQKKITEDRKTQEEYEVTKKEPPSKEPAQKEEAKKSRKQKEEEIKKQEEQAKREEKEKAFNHYHQLGLSSEEKGNYQKAIEAYQKALEINPDGAIIHLHLADIYSNYVINLEKANYHFKRYKVLGELSEVETDLEKK